MTWRSLLRPRHSARSAACCSRCSAHRALRARGQRRRSASRPSSRRARSTARVIARRARCSALRRAVLHRPVQRVPGRADRLRRLHHRALLAALHAHRAASTASLTPARLRLYHSMYQLFSFTMLLALHDQQHGHPVGGDGGGDADDRAAGERSTARRRASKRRGSTSSSAASASRRRCSARSCCTSPPRRCSAPAAARCCGRTSTRVKGQLEPDGAVARVRVPAGRLRHQGRPGAAAQLAARRARRRPDAGLGRALGPAAQRRAVRGRALQGAGRRRAADAASPAS